MRVGELFSKAPPFASPTPLFYQKRARALTKQKNYAIIKFNNINRENKNDNIGNIHFFILDSEQAICISSNANNTNINIIYGIISGIISLSFF